MVGSGGGSSSGSSSGSGSGSGSSSSRGGRRAGRRKNALHCLVMKQKLPRLYGITVWDLWPLLSCCWGYSLGLFAFFEFFMYTFVFVICSATLEGLPLLVCQDVLLGAITRRVEFASESKTVEKSLGPVHNNCSQFVSTNWGNCNCNKIGPCQQSLISGQPSTPDVIKC